MRQRKRGDKILFFDEFAVLTDQVHTMDGKKRILDLKCHQMKVKRERS